MVVQFNVGLLYIIIKHTVTQLQCIYVHEKERKKTHIKKYTYKNSPISRYIFYAKDHIENIDPHRAELLYMT